ncbi:MAG: hypothetical protein H6713_23245 [Myxococcales bacterium]|nr:hypothetical protein [Myxococcales bacterium]
MMLRAGQLSDDQLAATQAHCADRDVPFVEAVLELGFADQNGIVSFLHSKLMIPRVGASVLQVVDDASLARIPAELAHEFTVLPVSVDEDGNLTLAMADPTDMRAVDAISDHTGAYLVRAVAPLHELRTAIMGYYGPRPPKRPKVEPAPLPSATIPRAVPAGTLSTPLDDDDDDAFMAGVPSSPTSAPVPDPPDFGVSSHDSAPRLEPAPPFTPAPSVAPPSVAPPAVAPPSVAPRANVAPPSVAPAVAPPAVAPPSVAPPAVARPAIAPPVAAPAVAPPAVAPPAVARARRRAACCRAACCRAARRRAACRRAACRRAACCSRRAAARRGSAPRRGREPIASRGRLLRQLLERPGANPERRGERLEAGGERLLAPRPAAPRGSTVAPAAVGRDLPRPHAAR